MRGLCLTNFHPGPPISSLFLLVKKRLEPKKSEIGGEGCRDFHEKVSITPSSSSVLVTHEGSKEVFCSTEGRVEHLFLSADARGSVCPLHVRPHILDEAVF